MCVYVHISHMCGNYHTCVVMPVFCLVQLELLVRGQKWAVTFEVRARLPYLEGGFWILPGGVSVGLLPVAGVVPHEALHPQLLGHFQEGAELLLRHLHLAGVHEVEDGLQVAVLHPLQVEEGVGVGVPP